MHGKKIRSHTYDRDSEINIPQGLEMLMVYITAKKVLMSLQQYDMAKAIEELILTEMKQLSV